MELIQGIKYIFIEQIFNFTLQKFIKSKNFTYFKNGDSLIFLKSNISEAVFLHRIYKIQTCFSFNDKQIIFRIFLYVKGYESYFRTYFPGKEKKWSITTKRRGITKYFTH